jgi:hypothetical protein
MRASARFIVGALVLGVTACDHSPVPTPAAPAPVSPAVASVTIDGVPASLTVGQSVQLTASVTLSDGTRSDATTQVAWQSSDVAVATVSSAGLLAIAAPGDADVTATLQAVQGRAHLSVPRPPIPPRTGFDISGVVHESPPTEGIALSGATVGIHFAGCPSCPHDNETTTTGADGRFTLPGIDRPGFALIVSKPGYETTQFGVVELPRDQHPDIGLTPAFAMLSERYDFRYQRSECGVYDCRRDISFAVHHGGTLVVQECDGYLPGETAYVSVLRQGTYLGSRVCEAVVGGWTWPVEAGFVYTISTGGVVNGPFHIVFAHPN